MNSVDLSKTIAPKSDQLNADDLIAGAITITVTQVRGCDGDQPIAVHFEGDEGKPYKPCKSMRRVLVHAWGKEGKDYVGKRMTLYCDPTVQFGGVKVGGIRISHMSHIDRAMVIPLTVTRAQRRPYEVKPLRAEVRQGPAPAQQRPPQDLTLDDDTAQSDGHDAWNAAAWAAGQRDNADRIDDVATFETWWDEVSTSESAKRLWQTDEAEWKALRTHCATRLRSLKAQA